MIVVKSIMKNDMNFFGKFGEVPRTIAQAFTGLGVDFDITFYTVRANIDGFCKAITDLKVSSSKIMKGQVADSVMAMIATRLMNMFKDLRNSMPLSMHNHPDFLMIDKILIDHFALDFIKADHNLSVTPTNDLQTTKLSDLHAEMPSVKKKTIKTNLGSMLKEVMDSVPNQVTEEKSKKVSEEKVPKGVVALRDATHLKQKVKGTSQGSAYYTFALSDTVKLAYRVNDDAISIRAEGDMTKEDRKKLAEAGLTLQDSHMSLHLKMDQIPVARILGSVLYGLGMEFDKQIKAGEI